MPTNDSNSNIQSLKRLADRADYLEDKGPDSPEFIQWHAEVIEALRSIFGEDSDNLRDFKGLIFQLPANVTDAFKRMWQKVRIASPDEDNVTRLETLEQALDRGKKIMEEKGILQINFQFENALSEAKVILLSAQINLRSKK